MIRRLRLAIVLGAAVLWLAIDVACGATWRPGAVANCAAPMPAAASAKHCCAVQAEAPAPAKPACAADACGLTCATVLIAQVSDAPFELRPVIAKQRLAMLDFSAVSMRSPPPVPPPRV